MRVLVDTNILARAAQLTHSMSVSASQATNELAKRGEELICIPQICYEFWVVATRPAQANGLGMDTQSVTSELVRLQQAMTFLNDPPSLFKEWFTLVKQYAIIGKRAHDARLVAAMHLHQISHILTLNPQDFQNFAGITVLTPADVLSSSSTP